MVRRNFIPNSSAEQDLCSRMVVVKCSLAFRVLDLGELLILLTAGIVKSRAAHEPTNNNDLNLRFIPSPREKNPFAASPLPLSDWCNVAEACLPNLVVILIVIGQMFRIVIYVGLTEAPRLMRTFVSLAKRACD